MKVRLLLVATALALAGGYAGGIGAQTLSVVTAGDQNMVDYVNNYLAPKFEAMNPGVKVRAVGTGPGDSGSQKIYEKLSAQQKANVAEWDVDVAVVHQRGAATMVGEKLLMPYRNDGNAGTLDMLNRGEIAIGPVWVDMFYTWQADGRMSPKMKLSLPSPGLPGQPMYYVIPAKAAHAALAKKFIDLAESPEVQAEGIVKQFNWYPGIDPQHVQSKMDQASWNKLFTDISPSDLSRYGRPFPLSEYFTDIVEGYERVVIK